MKKIILIAVLFSITGTAFAQWEIGAKITPSIATNRVVGLKDLDFESLNAKTRFGGGITADYFFGANYAFSTGLIYNSRGAGVSFKPTATATNRESDEFNLQYLEIPVTIKLYTNDIAPDTKVYFQAGGSLDTRMAARVNGEKLDPSDNKYSKRFNLFDFSVLLGAGVERQLGESTKVFGGLSYHRGLFDVDDYYEERFSNKNIEIKNTYVALDLGMKF